MGKFNNYIEAAATEVRSQIAALHIEWTGVAAGSHLEWQDRWDGALEDMRDGLDKLTGAGKTAHTNYSTAVRTNTGMWP